MTVTKSQSAELARRIDALENEARKKIRETLPESAEQKHVATTGVVYDTGDEAAASTSEDFDHALLEHYLRELREIGAARGRLASGEINRCVDCEDEIGYRRLRAYPLATRFIECQTRHEKMRSSVSTPEP